MYTDLQIIHRPNTRKEAVMKRFKRLKRILYVATRRFVKKRLASKGVSLSTAQKILGLENVFPADNLKLRVPYPKKTLKAVAKENAKGEGLWKLVYKRGLPISKIHRRYLREFLFMPVWKKANTKKLAWMKEAHDSGYRLLNFKLKPASYFTLEIRRFNRIYPAQIATVLEALISIKQTTGVRMLEDEFHSENLKNGNRIFVGGYNGKGILAYMYDTADIELKSGTQVGGVDRAWCVSCVAPIGL